MATAHPETSRFQLLETTVADIHAAFAAGVLSARQLVELYLNRIEAYDRNGPKINSIITVNPHALDEAEQADKTYGDTGLAGPLHGIPVILKDQMDAKGMPTTLGSVVFKDYFPDRDSFVTEKLKKAGAIILAKATLGEMGRGDTHGSLFGSTRNPYDLDRTPGGSSGGPGASVSANFGAVAIGQEGFASIRRPAAWNGIVGMRPTAGLVSRGGVYAGWPSLAGSLGPLTRSVTDLATLLDVMAGYDPEDPLTSFGVGHVPDTFTQFLDRDGLRGARIGVMTQSMGFGSEPESRDFQLVSEIFERAIGELGEAGANVIRLNEIPELNELLAKRAGDGRDDEGWDAYFGRSAKPPYESRDAMMQSPEFTRVHHSGRSGTAQSGPAAYGEYLAAREELMFKLMKVMADSQLDAIVHKSVEHQPTLISEGVGPPHYDMRGTTHINTFLVYVPAISVPAGFTSDGLPVGITFTGRPYSDGTMIKLAYAYEQATGHRRVPSTAPGLPGEP
ncbi:MAG: amidase [Bacteroidetes bacterium]|nr:amidase [Bacteroidota bacterium]